MLLIALWISIAQAQDAGCSNALSTSEIATALRSAEEGYGSANPEQVKDNAAIALSALPCIQTEVPPSLVVQLHRVMALSSKLEGNVDRTRTAFAAARHVSENQLYQDPSLPEHIVPADRSFPIWSDFEAIPLSTRITTPMQAPGAETQIRLDGALSLERPTTWPVVYQSINQDGSVLQTQYLWPEDPAPNQVEPTVQADRSLNIPVILGAGSLVVAGSGAGLYLYTSKTEQNYCSSSEYDCSAEWLEENIKPRYAAATVLMIVGGVGLAGSGVVAIIGPQSLSIQLQW